MIRRDSHEAVSEELDKKDIEQRYKAVVKALEHNELCNKYKLTI